MPDYSSSVVLLWIEVHLDWFFFALQSMLERSRYPFFFWCVLRELRQFSLLTHLSHGMDKQLWGLSMFIALSEAEAPAPSSRAALSIL